MKCPSATNLILLLLSSFSRCQESSNSIDYSISPNNCGQQSSNLTVVSRIVGGRKAQPGEFPYQVSLQKRQFLIFPWSHFCGASIISNRWVLTAAHCVQGTSARMLRGGVGLTDLRNMNSNNVISFDRAIVHENYNSINVEYDIALLKTTQDIFTSTKAFSNAVCLPLSTAPIASGSEAIISGWGTTTEGGDVSDELLAANIKILNDNDCKSAYGDDFKPPGMLCAGRLEGGTDTCQGDSGGPLVQKTSRGYILHGITSWGKGCARANNPGVYTRVQHYAQWIKDTISSN